MIRRTSETKLLMETGASDANVKDANQSSNVSIWKLMTRRSWKMPLTVISKSITMTTNCPMVVSAELIYHNNVVRSWTNTVTFGRTYWNMLPNPSFWAAPPMEICFESVYRFFHIFFCSSERNSFIVLLLWLKRFISDFSNIFLTNFYLSFRRWKSR